MHCNVDETRTPFDYRVRGRFFRLKSSFWAYKWSIYTHHCEYFKHTNIKYSMLLACKKNISQEGTTQKRAEWYTSNTDRGRAQKRPRLELHSPIGVQEWTL